MSQYPTVNELLGNWSILTARRISFKVATNDVRRLLEKVTLEKCFDRNLWSELGFFALVEPDKDILPARTVFNGITQNIGINHLTSGEPIWFAGPDLISAILLSGGKVPRIRKAYRLTPHGKQAGLGKTNLRSMVEVNAGKDSLFKHVIEQRAANEANKSLHYFLKILANSGKVVATEEHLRRITKVPKREFMCRGINQHTLDKVCWKTGTIIPTGQSVEGARAMGIGAGG